MHYVTTYFYDVAIMPQHTSVERAALPNKPVPTKFKPEDQQILASAAKATGLTNADLIRRAVRLLGRQHAVTRRYDFLLDLAA